MDSYRCSIPQSSLVLVATIINVWQKKYNKVHVPSPKKKTQNTADHDSNALSFVILSSFHKTK